MEPHVPCLRFRAREPSENALEILAFNHMTLGMVQCFEAQQTVCFRTPSTTTRT